MSQEALGNGNKLFRRGIRHDFVEMLMESIEKQVPTQVESTEIQREVKDMTDFLSAIDEWESKVLDSFLMLKRCISRGHQNSEYRNEMEVKPNDILAKIRKLKVEVPTISGIKPVEEASDRSFKSAQPEVIGGSSDIADEKNDEPIKFEVGESSNGSEQKNEKPIQLETIIQKLNPEQTNCLYSLGIFPENTELKKRLLVHWWIGLGFLPCEGDASIMENRDNLFSLLADIGILIPKRRRNHNGVVDSFTINPTIHKQLISDHKGRAGIISDDMKDENSFQFYKDDKKNDVVAVLNVNQENLNSKSLSQCPTIKVLQLGKWKYPKLKTTNDETKLNDIIEADGTEFLEKVAKTVTYLSLNGVSRIDELPESVGNIRDLMVLDLRDCHNLQRLPSKPKSSLKVPLSKNSEWFKELRYLDITGCYLLDHMPKWVCELSNLQVLKGAVFNGFIPDQLRLRDLSNLRKLTKLSIKIMHSHFFPPEDFTSLASLKTLRILIIVWGIHETAETEMQKREDMRDGLSIPKTGGEEISGANEDQTTVTRKQSIKNPHKKLSIFRSRDNKPGGLNKDKMLEKEKQSKKASFFSFPENLEKLDIRCYPNAEAPELLNAAWLKSLKRLYIRGGNLATFGSYYGMQVEILRLRFLNSLDLDWYELSSKFPRLRCVNYETCRRLKHFPKDRSLWDKEISGPFPDRRGAPPIINVAECVQLTITKNDVAPIAENVLNVMLEFEINRTHCLTRNRPGLDLVAVLDTSRRMQHEDKLAKLKTAMLFLIKNLGPFDRLCIVTFDTRVTKHNVLGDVTEWFERLQNTIENLDACGGTNTFGGLRVGLAVLEDRQYIKERAAGIILVSNDDQSIRYGDATTVPVGNVAVHTFGYGKYHNPKELESIAHNSLGGSFTDVRDPNDLPSAFSACLEKLRTVIIVVDLTVIISPIKKQSTIQRTSVEEGQCQQSDNVDANDDSITFYLGNLSVGHARKLSVDLLLPAVYKQKDVDILKVMYEYRYLGELYKAPPVFVEVKRRCVSLSCFTSLCKG